MNDEELKREFNKQQKEWAKKQSLNPSRGVKIAGGGFKINPYDVSTIKNYIDCESEQEQDERIEILFNFVLSEWNELALERVIDYLIKYGKSKTTLKELKSRVKSELKKREEPFELKPLNVTNYLVNVLKFHSYQPFFYDKSGLFWFWKKDSHKWEIVDSIDMMNSIEKMLSLSGETVASNTKNNYIEAFKRIGRLNIPKDAPKKWIQFKDKAFSIESGKIYDVTPDYYFCNPIPYELGKSDKTPVMDKLFEEWVGKKWVRTLYEIIAYCCYTDYPIHLIFCFIGSGRNGKSTFLKLLIKFLGEENTSSTELDTLLNSRFESTKLYKKLICTVGETNFGVMNRTSLLKALVGQDQIGFEFKGKTPFVGFNYAKICICSNSLPTSEDTSDGFYRRWLIVDFCNQFPEGKDILPNVPEEEYHNLALKITKIIPELLKNGKFTNQGTISERENRYVISSNPLKLFIDMFCFEDYTQSIRYSELYTLYASYLKRIKKRIISKREFTSTLESEGFEIRRTTKTFEGTNINDRFVENMGLNRKKLANFMESVKGMKGYSSFLDYKQDDESTETTNSTKPETPKPQDVVVEEEIIQDVVEKDKKE